MSGNVRTEDPAYGTRDDDADGTDSPLLVDGEVDEAAVKETAFALFDRWDRERAVDAVRARVRNVASVSGLVAVAGWLVDLDGLGGLLLELWFFASLPIFVVASAIYATLRDPTAARDIWWEEGTVVALGLLAVAALARSADRSPAGRVAYQFVLGDDAPGGGHGYDAPDGIDLDRVRQLRNYLRLAIRGSLAVILFDLARSAYAGDLLSDVVAFLAGLDGGSGGETGGGGPLLPSISALPTDPLSILGLVVLAVVVGSIVGLAIGLRREL